MFMSPALPMKICASCRLSTFTVGNCLLLLSSVYLNTSLLLCPFCFDHGYFSLNLKRASATDTILVSKFKDRFVRDAHTGAVFQVFFFICLFF